MDDRGGDIRIGYSAAATLIGAEVRITWSAFSAMLIANSLILTTGSMADGFLRTAVPILGMMLCLIWAGITVRGFELQTYKVLCARELEQYLDEPVRTLSRGAQFHKGEEVTITLEGKQELLRLSWLGRLCQAKWLAVLVIAVFFALHSMLLLARLF